MSTGLAARVVRRLHREAVWTRSRVLRAASGAHQRVLPGTVALTFDDGPVPGSTDRVLDVLAAQAVQATFFCVGRNAEKHPRLLQRIAEEGHAVGSHSLTHPHPRDLHPNDLRREYDAGRDAVEQALGAPVPLFRPPHGHLSLRSARLLREHRPWLWTCDPEDWRPGTSREQVERVAGRAGTGGVVLLHDWVEQPESVEALDRTATVEALPAVVTTLRAAGYQLVGLQP